MRSFQINKVSARRATFLNLASQIGNQLREAYNRRHGADQETQSSVARKLGIGRSAVNRRLTGQINMTVETLADMVWALGYAIKVLIYDPKEARANHFAGVSTEGGPVVELRQPNRPQQALVEPSVLPLAA